MRTKPRTVAKAAEPGAGQEAQYCVLCDNYMLFERVDTDDLPADDDAADWICVSCGSAVFVDPPTQPTKATKATA